MKKLPTKTECLMVEKGVPFSMNGPIFIIKGSEIRKALESYAGKRFFAGHFPTSRYAGLMSWAEAGMASREDLAACEARCRRDNARAEKAELLLPNLDDRIGYSLSEREVEIIFLGG